MKKLTTFIIMVAAAACLLWGGAALAESEEKEIQTTFKAITPPGGAEELGQVEVEMSVIIQRTTKWTLDELDAAMAHYNAKLKYYEEQVGGIKAVIKEIEEVRERVAEEAGKVRLKAYGEKQL